MKLRDILVKFKTEITIRESEDKERNAGLLSSQHDIYDQAEEAIIKWAIDKLPKEKEQKPFKKTTSLYGRKSLYHRKLRTTTNEKQRERITIFNQAIIQARQALGTKK